MSGKDSVEDLDSQAVALHLQEGWLLDDDEKAEARAMAALTESAVSAERRAGRRGLQHLTDVANNRERGKGAELATRSSTTASLNTLAAERATSQRHATSLLRLTWMSAIIALTGFGAAIWTVVNSPNTAHVAASAAPLVLAATVVIILAMTISRLFQNARESAERMDNRSIAVRYLGIAIAHYQETEDYRLIEMAMALMPGPETERSATLGTKEYTAALHALRPSRKVKPEPQPTGSDSESAA
jgi:hypothetical protein